MMCEGRQIIIDNDEDRYGDISGKTIIIVRTAILYMKVKVK